LAWVVALPVLHAAASINAALDRQTVAAGESLKLSIVVEGATPEYAPQPPQVPNLAIQFLGSSKQFTVVNGRSSQSITLEYAVTARQPGDYTIPALTLAAGGQTLVTKPLQLKVLPPDPNDPNGTARLAFIRLVVPKKEAFVGEVIPLELQLYVQSAEDLQIPQLSGDGFTFSKPIEAGRSRGQSNGQLYNVLVFKLTATPIKTGELKLGPAECELTLLVQNQRRRRDPFDAFGGDISDFFGGRAERRRVKLNSAAETIVVNPLPTAGRPSDFSGAVGRFTFATTATPTSLSAGDPITITARIAGRGNLDGIQFTVPSSWNNFRSYPGTSKTEADPLGVEGTKTFELIVAPEIAEIKELPSLAFSFFDPDDKVYRTLTQPAVPIHVKPSTATQAQPTIVAGNQREATPPAKKDIVHIKTHLGTLTTAALPLSRQSWFWWCQSLPVGLFLAVLLWQRRNEYLSRNPTEQRRRTVSKAVQRGLNELSTAASQGDSAKFFSTLFRILQERLGERLNMPASAITESVIDDELRPMGADESLLADLHSLFQSCNQALYAPHQSASELSTLLDKARTVLARLETLSPKPSR